MIPSLRGRFPLLLPRLGILFGLAGLASAAWESASFGHQHLEHGHAVHHSHFYLGPHEHSHDSPDHDDDGPHEQEHGGHRHSLTLSTVPTLQLPSGTLALRPPVAVVALAPALPERPAACRLAIRLTPPRAPPAGAAAPTALS